MSTMPIKFTGVVHEPGIYYFMSNDEYHADPALGSSNIRDILKGPRRYWRTSHMNPSAHLYRRAETESTVMGTALHTYLLDGAAKFSDTYVRRPDDPPGATPAEKGQITKKFNASLLPRQIGLHGDDWALTMDAGRTITEHPDLKEVFAGGDHEVSVFWINAQGIRCKARFDILKPGGIGDLKSIANMYGDQLEKACKVAIKRYKYHIQAEHYLEGRRQLPALVKANKVFLCDGGKIHPLHDFRHTPSAALIYERLLACANRKKFAFQFIFISKEAPEAWGCIISPENPILEHARGQIDQAFRVYNDMLEHFGTNPWPETWRLTELYMEEMPGGEFGWN